MKRRLFIAINLPAEIKKKIEAEVEHLTPLLKNEIKFLKPENWHLTISFLGYQEENSMQAIIKAIQNTALNFFTPQIELEKISYGPTSLGASQSVRMIWFCGSHGASRKLSEIKAYLEDRLEDLGVGFRRENRQFNIHLTLARFDRIRPSLLPKIEKKITLRFKAKSLDLMESTLKRSGAEYNLLTGMDFRGD